jgi:HSP20 family protein
MDLGEWRCDMLELRPFPTVPTRELRRELDRLVESFLGPDLVNGGAAAFPALNIWEDGDKLYAEAEVPGLQMNDIELTVQGRELTIRGTRRGMPGDDLVYHRRERATGEFVRHVTLATEIDPNHVAALLQNGVLTLTLPKSEKARARKITIKGA